MMGLEAGIIFALCCTIHSTLSASVTGISPSTGGTNGAVKITIFGSGFAEDQYGGGNSVAMVTKKTVHYCHVLKYYSTTRRITCITPQGLVQDDYHIRVFVNRVEIPTDNNLIYHARASYTPRIDRILPSQQTGLPGQLLEIYGRIFSATFEQTVEHVSIKIRRVFANAEICKLKNENDTSYGTSKSSSEMGTIKCMSQGTYIGNTNISFIIDGSYGRSTISPHLLKVARNNQIYSFQTFAEITSVEPVKGCNKGGTRITITGQHFDESDAKIKILIGNSECKVTKPIQDEQVVCDTPPVPTLQRHPGNRGLICELFYNIDTSLSNLPSIRSLSSDLEGYEFNVIDEFSSDIVASKRIHGFFVPPHDGDYMFIMTKCGSGNSALLYFSMNEDPTKAELLIDCIQLSPRLQLKKDKLYYIEVLSRSNVRLSVRHFDTKITRSMTTYAEKEVQNIKFSSTVLPEIQQVSINTTSASTNTTYEVQEIYIEELSGSFSDASFQLGLFGVYTRPFITWSNTQEIIDSLNSLPILDEFERFEVDMSINYDGNVSMTMNVTFISDRGNIPDIDVKVTDGWLGHKLKASVKELISGESGGNYFSLVMENVSSPLINVSATDDQVKTSLEELFGTRCSGPLLKPSDYTLFYDFERDDNGATTEVEPFCGRYSAENPSSLIREAFTLFDNSSIFCFAYQERQLENKINLFGYYTYKGTDERYYTDKHVKTISIDFEKSYGWHYVCLDIFKETGFRPGTVIYRIELFKLKNVKNFYIDNVLIGNTDIMLNNLYELSYYRLPPVRPNGALFETIEVTKINDGVFNIILHPYDCINNFPLFDVNGQKTKPTQRIQHASPSIVGNYSILFKDKRVVIPHDFSYTEYQLETWFEKISSIGKVSVAKWGKCGNHDMRIIFETLPGNQPQLVVDRQNMSGLDLEIEVTTQLDGFLLYDPIPGDMLLTDHDIPQVRGYVNEIPMICHGNCTFRYTDEDEPIVTGILPNTGQAGTIVKIEGNNFGDQETDTEIGIGGFPCNVILKSTTSITCRIEDGVFGTHLVDLVVPGKGRAMHPHGNVTFRYLLNVTDITPLVSSTGGGLSLTISGFGFSENVEIEIGDKLCIKTNHTTTKMICKIPPAIEGQYRISISVDGFIPISLFFSFTYNSSITPIVTSASPKVTNVIGGDKLILKGQGFGTSGFIMIGDKTMTPSIYTNELVEATLPFLSPGYYDIMLVKDGIGSAVNENGSLPVIYCELEVNSFFPRKGSLLGGTRLTLYGKGFPDDKSLSDVKVGEFGCDVETVSYSKVVCVIQRTSNVVKINNQGTHPLWGIGYQWDPPIAFAQVGDIVEWTWTSPSWVKTFTHRVEQTINETSIEPADDGFSSGQTGTLNGKYQYQMNVPGEYHYWSGFTDYYEIVYYRGRIVVEEKPNFAGKVKVYVAGEMALNNFDYDIQHSEYSDCTDAPSSNDLCGQSGLSNLGANDSEFYFDECFTPVVSSLADNFGTTFDIITITGKRLTTGSDCFHSITFDESECTIVKIDEHFINCSISTEKRPSTYTVNSIHARIDNIGYALISIHGPFAKSFVFEPVIADIFPKNTSLNGDTVISITGSGFLGNKSDIFVEFGGSLCETVFVSYKEINCRSPVLPQGKYEVVVYLQNYIVPRCTTDCSVIYDQDSTPIVTTIEPLTYNGQPTVMIIRGKGFADKQTSTEVTVGGVNCQPITTKNEMIKCQILNIPVGKHTVKVFNTETGLATNSIQIESLPVITEISPQKGSIYGGTELTILGNGFYDNATLIRVNGRMCLITNVSLSGAKCITPRQGLLSSVNINVISNNINYPVQLFEYSPDMTPTITGIQPSKGPSDSNISIIGNNFGHIDDMVSVTVGGQTCWNWTSKSSTELSCRIAVNTLGKSNVVVFVNGFGYSNDAFTFETEFEVSSISKIKGSIFGGQTITVFGSGFDQSANVRICDSPCIRDSSQNQSGSQIICITSPASDLSNSSLCDVTVDVLGGSKKLQNVYTYDFELTPSISDVEPRRGGTGGGTSITITGTGFGKDKDRVLVTIAETPCLVTYVNTSEIVCITGKHAPSQKTVVRVEIDSFGIANQTLAEFNYIDTWSSPFTWGGYDPPENGTLVVIPEGHIILLDQNTAHLKMILIKGGELIFDEKDIELFAENILIVEGGKLTIGTEDQPFLHKAIITLTAHVHSKELPIYGTNSIGVRNGTLDIHGQPIPIVWTRLETTAYAGSLEIVLEESVNWRVGSEIVIASTGHMYPHRENEKHIIESVSPDQKTIRLKDKLRYDHIGVDEAIGGFNLSYKAEVGLLTRNVVLRAKRYFGAMPTKVPCPDGFEPDEYAEENCHRGKLGKEIGGEMLGIHIMLHPKLPMKDAVIAKFSYAEITAAGQAYRLDRYPVYFYMGGSMTSSYISGCSIHKTFNRAIGIEASHDITVDNNVVFDIMGIAVTLDDNVANGNSFINTLFIYCHSSEYGFNTDFAPANFLVTNLNNLIENNTVAGGSHFGFWYITNHAGANMQLSIFRNNTVHSMGLYALWVVEKVTQSGNVFKFYNLFAWHCERGSVSKHIGNVQYHDLILVSNKLVGHEQLSRSSGKYFSKEGALFMKGIIVGQSPALSGASDFCTNSGFILPASPGYLVDGTTFAFFNESENVVFSWKSLHTAHTGGFEYRLRNIKIFSIGKNNLANLRWNYEAILHDFDGKLTGKPHSYLVTSQLINPYTCEYDEMISKGVNASICPPDDKFARFSMEMHEPESFRYKHLVLTANNNTTKITGWMSSIAVNNTYKIAFEHTPPHPNISFSASISLLEVQDYFIFNLTTMKRPDCVSFGSGCVIETLERINASVHRHGNWTFDKESSSIAFLVSLNDHTKTEFENKSLITFGTKTISFYFKMYKCFYLNCIVPPDPEKVPPLTDTPTRRDNIFNWTVVYWSDTTTWPEFNYTLPTAGDLVVIPKHIWCIGDTDIPPLSGLVIYGVLELNHGDATTGYRDFVIETPYIAILCGRLIIGWEDKPFLGTVHILLKGHWFSEQYYLPLAGYSIGSKVIGVYGGLDMHGKPVVETWTTLNATVFKGKKRILINKEVAWKEGQEIVITPTGYNAWETETFKIVKLETGNGLSAISLNASVRFTHLGYSDASITISAEIGLLSRNIKIEGDNITKQSYGGHILVSSSGKLCQGYSRLSNVEFYHMGQEGYMTDTNPRFAISYLKAGHVSIVKPSYVRNCSFHHGLSPAIGVYDTQNLPIENNVIHHTVWISIKIVSSNTQIRRNMITLNIWEGAYQSRYESQNVRYNGAISAVKATSLILEGNRVSGSERMAYHLNLQSCSGYTSVYNDNVARTSLIGIGVFPGDDTKPYSACKKLSGFTIVKCSDFGIYYQSRHSLIISDVTLADNQIGIFPIIISSFYPYRVNQKTVLIQNVKFIGQTESFNCASDQVNVFDDNIRLSKNSRSFDISSHIGIVLSTFVQSSNFAPARSFVEVRSCQSVEGLTILKDIQFENFSQGCKSENYAITTNRYSDYGGHPMQISSSTFKDVPSDNRVYFYRPVKSNNFCDTSKCNGMTKTRIEDIDGSIVGSYGTIIPKSEIEWNWDYNYCKSMVPRSLLRSHDGTLSSVDELAPLQGLMRDSNCIYHEKWQAYHCSSYDYKTFILESMDSASAIKRAGPVAILGHDNNGTGVINLLNVPKSIWLCPKSCFESVFQGIVALGVDYLIHFARVTPLSLRLVMPKAKHDEAILIRIWYSQPYRLDVYFNGVTHIMPVNGRWKYGAYILDPPPIGQPDAYKPDISQDDTGTNWYDRQSGLLYVVLKGPTPIIVKTAKQVVVSFKYPAMSVNQFYGERIVEYLADFFDLPPRKVRIVNIASAQSFRRGKRSTDMDNIIIEIGDSPYETLNDTTYSNSSTFESNNKTNSNSSDFESNDALIIAFLEEIYFQAVLEAELGNYSVLLNGTVLGIEIVGPHRDPNSPEWDELTTSDGFRVVVKVDHLGFEQMIVPSYEQALFLNQPKICAYDVMDTMIGNLGTTVFPWKITASSRPGTGHPNATLDGTTTIPFIKGWANFTDLSINLPGNDYIIDFKVTSPLQAENFTLASYSTVVSSRPISVHIENTPTIVCEDMILTYELKLQDAWTKELLTDISWRNHTWNATLDSEMLETRYNGSIDSTSDVKFDPLQNKVIFTNITLRESGVVVFDFQVRSTPEEYDFNVQHLIVVRGKDYVPDIAEETGKLVMKISTNETKLMKADFVYIAAVWGSLFVDELKEVFFDNFVLIPQDEYYLLEISLSGIPRQVTSSFGVLCILITNYTEVDYQNTTMFLLPYMMYNQTDVFDHYCNDKDKKVANSPSEENPLTIVAVVVGCIAGLVIFLLGLWLWKKCVRPKNKTSHDPYEYGTHFEGDVDIYGKVLFREVSFMSLSKAPVKTTWDSKE